MLASNNAPFKLFKRVYHSNQVLWILESGKIASVMSSPRDGDGWNMGKLRFSNVAEGVGDKQSITFSYRYQRRDLYLIGGRPRRPRPTWQELADEFGTFDWAALYQDMCVFPQVAVRVLGWKDAMLSSTK